MVPTTDGAVMQAIAGLSAGEMDPETAGTVRQGIAELSVLFSMLC